MKNKETLHKGEVINTPLEKISSIEIENNGILIQDIIVKKLHNSLKVSFLDADDKIIELPLKFGNVSIWLARQKQSPYYLGVLSYGELHCGRMIQYQVVKNLPNRDILQIYLSLEGKPRIFYD